MRTCPECQNSYEDEILHCPEDGLDLSALEPVDELIGRSIGSYQIVKMLGKGGMGAVYMAQHPVIGSRVAIKFLLPQYSTDPKIVDRFFNEAKAVNVIGHDNILKILDLSVTDDNRHYFVMEFLYGKPLQDYVRPNQPMDAETALPILLQCCEALQAAHDNKIIHRDLKPDNIYLITHKGKKNFVKIVDFGIAKLTDAGGQSTGKTQTGMVMGTPAYMSPEQAGGMTSMIDGRSDIYSLGVMMYQMLSGKLPFPGSSFGEVLIGHLQQQPPPPTGYNPNLAPELEAIILKTLEKRQDDRFQSMRDLHDAILGYMNAVGMKNELPAADPSEMVQPQPIKLPTNPPRTQNRTPGPTTRKPSTGPGTQSTQTSKSSPGQKTSAGRPSAMGGQPADVTDQQQPLRIPAPPPQSRTGLYVGIGIAVVAVLGLGGYVMMERQQKNDEEMARLQDEAKQKEKEAKAAAEARRRAEEEAASAPIALAVTSDPSGAEVMATWKGGSMAKSTPFMLEVPKLTSVHLVFKMKGFLDEETDAVADQPKPVQKKMRPDPAQQAQVAKATEPPARQRRGRRPSSDSGSTPPKDIDSTIQVDFGDDALDPANDKKKQ